jgi:hypothetical protein
MDAGQIRSMDPEGLAYALIGIGHFVALRWLIWPQEDGEGNKAPLTGLPDPVLDAVITFILHGLTPPETPVGQASTPSPDSPPGD